LWKVVEAVQTVVQTVCQFLLHRDVGEKLHDGDDRAGLIAQGPGVDNHIVREPTAVKDRLLAGVLFAVGERARHRALRARLGATLVNSVAVTGNRVAEVFNQLPVGFHDSVAAILHRDVAGDFVEQPAASQFEAVQFVSGPI
jgi:hypothetical protein